jgi:hypothetical protein
MKGGVGISEFWAMRELESEAKMNEWDGSLI